MKTRSFILSLLFFCALARADQVYVPPSSGGGSGVVNGQILRDNAGAVFLNAGTHLITSDNYSITEDGQLTVVGVEVGSNGLSVTGGTTTVIDDLWIDGFTGLFSSGVVHFFSRADGAPIEFFEDGSANFSGGINSTRIVQRVATLTDAATVTPDADSYDGGILTELSQDSTIANPTGTPTDQQRYLLRIKSSASQALTWGSEYRGSTGIPLATATTGGGKVDYFVLIRDVADSKWHVMPNTGF